MQYKILKEVYALYRSGRVRHKRGSKLSTYCSRECERRFWNVKREKNEVTPGKRHIFLLLYWILVSM